jgi:peptidoglycan/LPS O-acetylase OafA/YrhL
VEDRLELFLVLRAFQDQRKLRTGAAILFLAATALAVWSMKTWNDVRMDDTRLRELAGGLLHNVYRARLTLRDIGGAWKLTGLDILEEERL